VPVLGKSEDEILSSAEAALASPADLIEWRMDWFEKGAAPQAACQMLKKLRTMFACPILATFRTKAEGGEQAIAPEDYISLNLAVCESGMADLLDIEYFLGSGSRKPFLGKKTWEPLLASAKTHGVKTVFSNHDFEKTPPREEIVARLSSMEEAGGDISKIAVMPKTEADVFTLLAATFERKQSATAPIITMSMGRLGAASRLSGQFFGSCLTFGSASAASAPGQPSAKELRQILELTAKAMSPPSQQ